MTTPILNLPEAYANQYNLDVTINEITRQLEATTMRVLSATTVEQPASPSNGDSYILPSGATGTNWAAYPANTIAYYANGLWRFVAPTHGWFLRVADTGSSIYYNGTDWVDGTPAVSMNSITNTNV